MPEKMKTLVRVAAFYILFGIIPIAVGMLLLKQGIAATEAADLVAAVSSMRSELSELRSDLDPKNFYSRWFDALSAAGTASRQDLEQTRKRIERWGSPVDLFRFNAASELATMTWSRDGASSVMRTLWHELHPGAAGSPHRSREMEVAVDLLLGGDFSVGLLKTAGPRGMVIKSGSSDNLLFWKEFSAGGGLICAVWRFPGGEELLRKRTKLKLRSKTMLFAGRPGEPWRVLTGTGGRQFAERVSERFRLYNNPWLESDGFVWVKAAMGETELLACRQNPDVAAGKLRRAVDVVSALLAIGMLIFWYRWLVLGADLWVSVRVKMIFLFLFSTLFPLAGLAGLAAETVAEREKVLMDRAFNRGKTLLESVDAGYEADRHRLREIFRRIRDDALLRTSDPDARQKRTHALKKKHGMIKIELRDSRGELVASTDNPEMLARVDNVFRVMAQIGLERHAPERIPPDASSGVRQVDMLTRMAFESPVLGLSSAMDQPDKVLNLDFSLMRGLWYWDVIRDLSHPAAFINIVKDKQQAVDYYLKQCFATHGKAGDGFGIFAYDTDSGILTGLEKISIPGPLRALLDQSRVSGGALTGMVAFRRAENLIVTLPSVFMGRRQLLTAIPKNLALSALDDFKTAVWLMFLVIALSAVISGRILADLFLRPIAELAAGMTALQGGDTSVRVRVASRDEFGELGHAFNRMLEDMQEVRMAKMVQDSLAPAGMLKIPGFDAFVTMNRVSDLSGDYVDAMKLADERWLLVTGDVSGHGTSAALTMAMAKSITVQCAEDDGDPVNLLATADRILFQLLKRRQLMYFSAARLDPATGAVDLSSGGAPYPFILRRNGSVEMLQISHLPLASSPNPAPFPRQGAMLEHGDILMLYTDGLLKNRNAAGDQFGHERLEQAIRSAPLTSAVAFSESIIASYAEFVGKAAGDDDLSMLIIRRDPGPDANRVA